MATYTFEEVYNFYLASVYERETLVDGIAELLHTRRCENVLDCACGTGLPALDLRARGFTVDCSDADPRMLRQFQLNARALGVDDSCRELRWDELPSLGRQYDYVMCRGNSLVYAESWGDAVPTAANRARLEQHIRNIAAVVAPGGYLHIDAPRVSVLGEASHPETTFRGVRVKVREHVTAAGGSRRWEQHVAIGDDEFSFVRYSTNMTGSDLEAMLRRCGFSVETVELVGERPSYTVLVARKPGALARPVDRYRGLHSHL